MTDWLTRIGCIVALVLLVVVAWLLESDWHEACEREDFDGGDE